MLGNTIQVKEYNKNIPNSVSSVFMKYSKHLVHPVIHHQHPRPILIEEIDTENPIAEITRSYARLIAMTGFLCY